MSEPVAITPACLGVWHISFPREAACPKCGETGPQQWNDTMCDHAWQDMGGDGFTSGVGYRYCRKCDREEWDNGVVRPGYIRPLVLP